MPKIQRRLGEVLVGRGLITPEQLEKALAEQKSSKEFLGEILLKHRYLKDKELLVALCEQFNLPAVSLKDSYLDWELVKSFSSELILGYQCFPLKKDERNVTVAITNPLDMRVIQKAEEGARGLKLKLALTTKEDMQEAIGRYKQHLRGNIAKLF